MPVKVLVIGSANLDLVVQTPRFPHPGETLLGGVFSTHPGGKGANQAVAAARLGDGVAFAGCIGSDSFAGVLTASLESAGAELSHLRHTASPTGIASILVDAAGANTIVVAPGANYDVTTEHVREALEVLQPTVVLSQLEIPLEAVVEASRHPRFILNPAPARRLPDELLANCHLITPNETETMELTGVAPIDEASCARASRELFARGVQNVIITLGEQGCYYACPSGGRIFPAPKVEPIDTTAAGDAFNGALAHFLADGLDFDQAIPPASVYAALSTTHPGAQESMPTREAFDAFRSSLSNSG